MGIARRVGEERESGQLRPGCLGLVRAHNDVSASASVIIHLYDASGRKAHLYSQSLSVEGQPPFPSSTDSSWVHTLRTHSNTSRYT